MEGRIMAQGFDKLPSWTVTIFLFGILTIAHQAAAQFHTAPWTLIGRTSTSPAVARIDGAGKITTVMPWSALPPNMFPVGGTIDVDDRSIVMAFGLHPFGGGLLFFDRWGAIRSTIYLSGSAVDVIVDDDGSYVVAGQNGMPPLQRVSRTGSITTIYVGIGRCVAVQVDIDTGDYRVVDSGSNVVLGIDRSGKAVTTLATLPKNIWFLAMRQHVGDGSLYIGSSGLGPSPPSMFRVSRFGAVTTFLGTAFSAGIRVRSDRVSAPRGRLAVCVLPPNTSAARLSFVDEKTQAVTPWAAQPISCNALIPPREVASLRIAPGQWEFGLHFAGHAGKAYAMGFSLSGVRPPVALGDGRRIHLAVDSLTALSLSGQLAPILTHNVGILGATDRAVVHLDLRALPEDVAGFNLYGLAVVLDPAAPLGVAIIADPIRVRL